MAKSLIVDKNDFRATMKFLPIHSDGSKLGSDCMIWDSMWAVLNKIKTSSLANFYAYKPTEMSVYDFISNHWSILFEDLDGECEKAILKCAIEWQSYYASNWETTSIGSMAVDKEFEGDQLLIANGGYNRILNGYLNMPDLAGTIRLNSPVKIIERSPDGPCKVITENGVEYEADVVVVTVPLGVLKKGSINFVPPLPETKLSAIERLGFGVYDKIFVTFNENFDDVSIPNGFWKSWADVISIVPKADDDYNEYLRVAKPYMYDSSTSARRKYYGRDHEHIGIEMANLSNVAGVPKLVMLIYGEAAIYMESIADNPEELKHFALSKLKSAFPDSYIPEITEVLATKWGSDRFAYGSFANIPIGSSGQDMINLSEPVDDKILFAGEATFPLHYSTVHGAMKSGRREFARLMKTFYPTDENIYEDLLENQLF